MLGKPFKKCESYGVSTKSAIGLVGYDTALTRQGSRVRAPVHVVFFLFARHHSRTTTIISGILYKQNLMENFCTNNNQIIKYELL